MGVRVRVCSGQRVLGFRVEGLGVRVQGLGFTGFSLGFRGLLGVQGLGVRVPFGLGSRD